MYANVERSISYTEDKSQPIQTYQRLATDGHTDLGQAVEINAVSDTTESCNIVNTYGRLVLLCVL